MAKAESNFLSKKRKIILKIDSLKRKIILKTDSLCNLVIVIKSKG